MLAAIIERDLSAKFGNRAGKTFRREIYPLYKAHRDAMPADLAAQLPYIRKMPLALNIPGHRKLRFEADDLIVADSF